jgi:hypothetical protein
MKVSKTLKPGIARAEFLAAYGAALAAPGLPAVRAMLEGHAGPYPPGREIDDEAAATFLALTSLAEPLLAPRYRDIPWRDSEPVRAAALKALAGARMPEPAGLAPWVAGRLAAMPDRPDSPEGWDWHCETVAALYASAQVRYMETVVFTPAAAADFTVRSTAELLAREHPGREPSWLDPFAGQGIFLCRVIELGLLDADIARLYRTRLEGQEYDPYLWHLGKTNVEASFWRRTRGAYGRIEAAVRLMDTFQGYEAENAAVPAAKGGKTCARPGRLTG